MVEAATTSAADPPRSAPRFKGWQVVAAAFVILFTSSGLGFYALAVYLDALTDDGGFTVGEVSVANFLFFLTAGVAGLLAARLIVRYDIRVVAAAGGVIGGISLGMIGHADHLWSLYVLYVVFGLGWALCGMVPATTVVTRWFHRRRSLALSVASTGLSVGGIVITPFVKTAIEDHGHGGGDAVARRALRRRHRAGGAAVPAPVAAARRPAARRRPRGRRAARARSSRSR